MAFEIKGKGVMDNTMSYEGIQVSGNNQIEKERLLDKSGLYVTENENEVRKLKEKLNFTEGKLAKLQEVNSILFEKFQKTEEELKVRKLTF